jgi:hypothetical protein
MPQKTIAVRGGLDLSPNRLLVQPGRLVSCQNYIVTKDGDVRRALGYRKFSGGCEYISPAIVLTPNPLNGFSLVPSAENYPIITTTWGEEDGILLDNGTLATFSGRARYAYSVAVSDPAVSTQNRIVLTSIQGRFPRASADAGTSLWTISESFTTSFDLMDTFYPANWQSNAFPTGVLHEYLTHRTMARWGSSDTEFADRVITASPVGKCKGQFFWRDRLYQVVDLMKFSFDSGSEQPSIGDQVLLPNNRGVSGNRRFVVDFIEVTSGAWNAGTAAGFIYVRGGVYEHGEAIAATSLEKNLGHDMDNITSGGINVLTIDDHVRSDRATLIRSRSVYDHKVSGGVIYDSGWEHVDLGYEVRFTSGDNAFLVVNRLTKDDRLTGVDGVLPSASTWQTGATATGAWTTVSNALADDGAVASASNGSGAGQGFSTPLTVTNFGFSVPSYSIITGIEVEIDRRVSAGSATDFSVTLVGGPNDQSANRAKGDAYTGTLTKITYGSQSDTWDSEITPELVNSTGFGVRFRFAGTSNTVEVDSIRLRVHYKTYAPTVVFRTAGGIDVAVADAVWYYKDKGDWTTNDAEGVLTIYNVRTTGGVSIADPTSVIVSGQFIRSAISGGGTLYATTAGAANRVYLPSSKDCERNNSLYEFISANFYGARQYEQIFGVSGAGLAFSYDGKYAIRIRTGVAEGLDKPRHAAEMGGQLALGYDFGDVVFSDVGAPESYAEVSGGSSPVSNDTDFVGGATVMSLADKVHGLLRLPEQSLAVFGQNSIRRISGSAGGFTSQDVRPQSGIVEYTARDLGGLIMFTDFRGIVILRPTDLFGQLLPQYVSAAVSSWLSPRLQRASAEAGTGTKPLKAELIKANNEYRLFFEDGYALCCTLVGGNFDPQFALLKYPVEITATCNGITSSGKDVVFAGCSGYFAGTTQAGSDYAYQLDIGTTHDGTAIASRCEIHLGDLDSPDMNKRFNHVTLYGQHRGYATLAVGATVDYAVNDAALTGNVRSVTWGSRTNNNIAIQQGRASVDIDADGVALTIQVQTDGVTDYATGTAPTNYKYLLPHTITAVTCYYTPERDATSTR